MDIKIGVKLHNRFDIEVKDVLSGEIVQRAHAENIVLNGMYSHLCSGSSYKVGARMHYGQGAGTLSATRTALFSSIGIKTSTVVERVFNNPPTPMYLKTKIVIAPEENVGATLTEVGLGIDSQSTLLTHALLEDSEGNTISIGPKTDTQEITIYSTLYVEISSQGGIDFPIYNGINLLMQVMTGALGPYWLAEFGGYINMYVSSDASATQNNVQYLPPTGLLGTLTDIKVGVYDVPNRITKTNRVRFGTSVGNGKIKSLTHGYKNGSSYWPIWRLLFANSAIWSGYNLVGKAIGTGDGSTVAFNLPWSDINTSKTYKIYVDGIEKTEGVDYTLSNSESTTTVTFATAPANGLPITGDWWVDYIPKDSDHVLDVTLTIQYGSV